MTEKEHGSVAMGDSREAETREAFDRHKLSGWSSYYDFSAGYSAALARPVQEPVAFITPSALADLRREIGGLYQMKPPRWTNEETTVALYLAAPQPVHGTSATERVAIEAVEYVRGYPLPEVTPENIRWRTLLADSLATALATPTPKEESK